MTWWRAMMLGFAAAATLALGGCGPKTYADPIAKMMDRTESHSVRWGAVKQAEQNHYNDPRRISALQRLVWERGYPAEYSNYAVDQLIAIDEAAAKKYLAKTIVLIEDWDTRQYVIDAAVKRGWTDFVPALVRSYAQRTPVYRDEDRPERKAIEKLMPGVPLQQVIVNVFATNKDAEITQRAAAWSLLHRTAENKADLVRILADAPGDDPLIDDLRAAAMDLAVVPDNLETVTWIRMLRTPPYANFWQRGKQAVARLNDEQRAGMQPRHIPVIIHLVESSSPIVGQSRDQLLADAFAFDAQQRHHLKGPTYDGPMDEVSQDLRYYHKELTWPDLAVIRFLAGVMSDPVVTAAWFEQATADEKDKSTEFGGLLRMGTDGRPTPVLYRPMMRKHDLIYYPPPELVTDAYSALAHYHFHAQSFTNRLYAGPGRGDMERIADRQQFNGLVLTFISRDELNVDYYQPGRQLIDLGTIYRR